MLVEIKARVDLGGVDLVENDFFGDGCSSSIAIALTGVDERCEVLVLMLGDQPGVTAATVGKLLAGRGDARSPRAPTTNGRGHPLAFARSMFDELASLHGDKGVWKLLDRRAASRWSTSPSPGRSRVDVDTWEDYEAVLRGDAASISSATERHSVT